MSKFRRFVAISLLTCLIIAPLSTYASDHTQDVAFTKSILMAQGVNLSGACGAFQITGRVAFKLKDQGFKLLRKAGGNRAIILADGTCVDGDHGSGPGYATDYLISLKEGFVGYDLLGDGGGQNAPQWLGPESDAELVARNAANFAEPFALGGDVVVPTPTPAPTPAPVPVPTPTPVDPPSSEVIELLRHIIEHQQEQIIKLDQIDTTTKNTDVRLEKMDRTLSQTVGLVSAFIGKYIAPALAGYLTARQLNK